MKQAIVYLLFVVVAGCNAGLSSDLLTYDLIEATAQQTQRALDVYDEAMRAQAVKDRQALVAIIGADIRRIAEAKLDPNQAISVADRFTTSLSGHLANEALQADRRRDLYAAASDNLALMREQVAAQRTFAVFRADIRTQWAEYLKATAAARLAKTQPSTPAQPTRSP